MATIELKVKKYRQEGDMQHTYSPLKNILKSDVRLKKSLVPLVIICMSVLLALLIAFYIFLRFYNKYTFTCVMNPDGASCTITEIGDRAIMQFVYFPDELEIPETVEGVRVTGIGAEAAKGDGRFKTVIAGAGITDIGEGAFEACENLESVILGGNLETVGDNAFKNCFSLASIERGSAKSIGEGAFEGCASLVSFNFSATENVGERAFYGCSLLEKAEFGAACRKIGNEAFWGCRGLPLLK